MLLVRTEFRRRELLRSCLVAVPRNLHWAFLLLATPLVVFLALRTPPFQVADEAAHFERAYQVAHGQLFGGSGGSIDLGMDQLAGYVRKLPFHSHERFEPADQSGAAKVKWAGRSAFHSFPNTAACAPTGYIPQALGVMLAQATGSSVLWTLIVARLFNGGAAILLCTLALSWCRSGKVVMFAILLFPMTLSLFASASQDATLIALTCLAFGLVSKAIAGGVPLSRGNTAVLLLSLLIILVGRPPYAALLLILFTPGLMRRWGRCPSWLMGLCFAAVSVGVTVAWWLAEHASTGAYAFPDAKNGVVDMRRQVLNLLHHPSIVLSMAGYIAHNSPQYIAGLIGYLGWSDTLMPSPYYLVMLLVLSLAVVAELTRAPMIARSSTAIILVASFVSLASVFLVEYLIWTPVGASAIYGVQGRYGIPLAIAAGVGLPQLNHSEKIFERATAIVLLAQTLTVVVLPRVILGRYYGA